MIRFKKDDGSNYPDLEQHTLKEYLKFKNGLNVPKEKFGAGIKYISVLDILNNTSITYDVIKGLVDIDEDTLKEFLVEYGDVLFQRSSETKIDAGKANVYLDKEKMATFGGFVIRGKKIGEYNPQYMSYLLKSTKVRKQIIRKAQGEQHVNVGQEILETVRVDMPCIEEQQRIADFLSAIDDVICASEKEVVNLEEQKKGVMQKIFSKEIRFKGNDGSDFSDWEEKKLGDIAEIYQPKTISGSDILEDGKYFVYGANGIIGKYNEYNHTKEQIAICCRGASCGALNYTLPFSWITGNAMVVNVDKFNVNKIYLFSFLQQVNFKKIISGGAQPQITREPCKKIKVKLPCLEEQQKIADFLSDFDTAIEKAKAELECWKEIKKGLLQQLFE